MNAPVKNRAARVFTVQINVRQAAATLTQAVYCNLALLRETVDQAVYANLFASAYTLILRVIQGKPCTGTVPLPIFQLLAALRSRVIDLKNGQVLALTVQRFDGETAAYLPTPPTDIESSSVSYFCHYSSQLMGALIDLKDIDRESIAPIPSKGYHNPISIGRSLGPLNFRQTQNGRFGISALQQKYDKTEQWMSHFTWASAYYPTGNYDTVFLDYPASNIAIGEMPPEVPILATALRIAEVVGADKFDFPALDIPTIHAYLKANAIARSQQYSTSESPRPLPTDFEFDIRNALAAASAVGLKAGQAAFVPAFLRSNEHLIPQDIAESCIAGPSVRSTLVRIPIVFLRTATSLNGAGTYPIADGTVNGVDFANAFVAPTATLKTKIGVSNAEFSVGASAFLNNTYERQYVGARLTWSGVTPNWGGTTTVAATGAVVPLTAFSNTIGTGPLSKPCGDKPIRGLNFADLTADRAPLVDAVSTLTVLAYRSVNSYTGGLKSENLQILSSFPLAREAVVTATGVFEFTKTPYTRTQLNIIDPAFKSVLHTVVEPGAAKYTEVQNFISNLNKTGMGGDGLFGDVARRAGLAIGSVAMNAASATGTYLANSAVNGLYSWYHGKEMKVHQMNQARQPIMRQANCPQPQMRQQNVGQGGLVGQVTTLLRQLEMGGQTRPGRRARRRGQPRRGGMRGRRGMRRNGYAGYP
jgi:hypothetical protein